MRNPDNVRCKNLSKGLELGNPYIEEVFGANMELLSRRLILSMLVIVCIVTFLFGLWPLNFFPENRVRWLDQQDGIQFYKRGLLTQRASGGVVYSLSPVDVRTETQLFVPTTIELYVKWHEKKENGLAHILSLHDGYPRSSLVIGQWRNYLVVRSRDNQNAARDTYRKVGLSEGIDTNEKILFTIASGHERTEIYVNGTLSRSYDVRSLIGVEHFSGYLNLGNSSIGHNAWVGNLYSLAFYDKFLNSDQIQQNYELWMNTSVNKPVALEPKPMILYTFAERTGYCVHNQMSNSNHLTIPSRFRALRSDIVVWFWRDMEWDKAALKDIVVNILGFVPFALCILIFLTKSKNLSFKNAAFLTVLTGVILSLIIETSQIALPTRTPSSLDLLCNTAGAVLGIILLRIILVAQNKTEKNRLQEHHVRRNQS
jgi:uncharacterized membrane protein